MTTNQYFNNYNASNEQTILEDLIIESIKTYGQDMIYLPRHNENPDNLYGTSDIVSFSDYYPIEMYLTSVDGFAGDGDFMSKFGLEIRDQIVLSISRKRFLEELPSISRPREGDLIYFPLNEKCFEIKRGILAFTLKITHKELKFGNKNNNSTELIKLQERANKILWSNPQFLRKFKSVS